MQLETKRLEVEGFNFNNTKEDEQNAIKTQIEQTNLDILKTQGNLQFAKKEEDNLTSEI